MAEIFRVTLMFNAVLVGFFNFYLLIFFLKLDKNLFSCWCPIGRHRTLALVSCRLDFFFFFFMSE